MQSDAEQAALRIVIHRKIQHCALNAADDALYSSGVFLENKEVAGSKERHADGCIETGHNGSYN
jgi:hypothetical protein